MESFLFVPFIQNKTEQKLQNL